MSKIFLEILDPERQKVFTRLTAFCDDGYLAGGTALALQLGHRVSIDFDVFTFLQKDVRDYLNTKKKQELP